jgi:hypothetical protein
MRVEKPSLAMYREYSGAGTVENAIAARNAYAMSQKPAACRPEARRGPVDTGPADTGPADKDIELGMTAPG